MSVVGVRWLRITDRLADELKQWAEDERGNWPEGTAFQADLIHLLYQLSPDRIGSQAQERCADCMGLFNRLAAEAEADKADIAALKAMIRINFLRLMPEVSHAEIDSEIARALSEARRPATPTAQE